MPDTPDNTAVSRPDAPARTPLAAPGSSPVRARFCPSPTGTPHVGMVRTCLFNWAWARHTGGTFVFRIEDTDAARDSEESFKAIIDSLTWLGLDWDEGVGVGGPHGPYRQSQRMDLYRQVAAELLQAGYLYESFSTPEEVEARHRARGEDPKLGYDGYDRDLTEAQKAAYRAEGRRPVLRMRMPDEDITFTDLVRGPITFRAGSVPDYVVVRAGGDPLYTLVNPVDDAAMGITHVLRGEDLLSSTPRQIALYRALTQIGRASAVPRFGHLPYVMGEGNRKLSKRDPQSNLLIHRHRGMLPEGLINYLALLGWSLSRDQDVFSPADMVEAFEVTDVNPNPARFDPVKCEAINAEHIRLLEPQDFRDRLVPYLADVYPDPADPHWVPRPLVSATTFGALTAREQEILTAAAPPGPDPRPAPGPGARHARLPARARRRPPARGEGRGQAQGLRPGGPGRRAQRPGAPGGPGVDDGAAGGGPARRHCGGPGHKAAPGLRAPARGRHRPPGLPAAVRVHGDPGGRQLPGPPDRCRPARAARGMAVRRTPLPVRDLPQTPHPHTPPRPARHTRPQHHHPQPLTRSTPHQKT